VQNLVISDVGERGLSRVSFDIHIPTTIEFVDSTGRAGTARAYLDHGLDILMRVPRAGFQSYSVESTVNLEALRARFDGIELIAMTCCVVVLTRLVGDVDLIIPVYGTVDYDECDNVGGCQAFFDTPFFSSFNR